MEQEHKAKIEHDEEQTAQDRKLEGPAEGTTKHSQEENRNCYGAVGLPEPDGC